MKKEATRVEMDLKKIFLTPPNTRREKITLLVMMVVLFRHTALNFFAIHPVFLRKFALSDGKIPCHSAYLEILNRLLHYQVEVGYDGEQAVELAREGGFDLVLLDLMMPKIDGLQACMRIREFSNVPIIMLTCHVGNSLLCFAAPWVGQSLEPV